MAGAGDQLLATALRFGQARLRQLADEAIGLAADEIEQHVGDVAAKLAALLGTTPAAVEAELAVGRAARTHLINARTGLATFATQVQAVVATPSLPGAQAAVVTLVAALDELSKAIDEIVPGSGKTLADLVRPVTSQVAAASGLVAQLQVPAVPQPAGITFDATTRELRYRVARPNPAVVGAAPLAVDLGATTLDAVVVVKPAAPSFAVRATIRDAKVALAGGAIAGLLGGSTAEATVTLELGVDSANGLTVGFGGKAAISLPPPPKLTDLLDVKDLRLALPGGAAPGSIDLASTISSKLGGVATGTVDGAGLRFTIDPAKVMAGQPPISIGFAPPTGLGLVLEAGPARGGGYLAVRPRGDMIEFAGALELKLGPIGVTGAGILTVGGDVGFALVIVMGFEFVPAIELSFGFTLNAVGGVLGIQHVIDVDALKAGLRSGVLDQIMFPKDAVASAPTIVAALGSVFPVRKGGAVVGPMLQLGWGRPISFVTASLGVIFSAPDPKLVIIGRFRMAVPAPELPIIDLRADLLGEFSAERVLILVSLHDSRIATFSVYGDIGLLIRFGSSPEFALSAGGFHPRYQPPPELADLRRIGMDLSPPAILTLRSESYVALTSNSFQLGTKTEMGIDVGFASAEGFLTFDAIVRFAPTFSFEIDLAAGITVRVLGFTVGGIRVALHLEGPAPWRAHGTATIELPWPFDDVDIDVGPLEWGERNNPPPAPAHPRELIAAALRKPEAWAAQLAPAAESVVRLRALAETTVPVVHPLGRFEVRQHAAPFERTIARIGPNPVPAAEQIVHITAPTVNGTPVPVMSMVDDLFSAGQFLDLSDDERLSRPAFEPMPAGLRLDPAGTTGVPVAAARQREYTYETFVVGVNGVKPRRTSRFPVAWLRRDAVLSMTACAAATSAMRAGGRYAREADAITLADASVVNLASVADLTAVGGALTDSQAREHLSAGLQVVKLGVG